MRYKYLGRVGSRRVWEHGFIEFGYSLTNLRKRLRSLTHATENIIFLLSRLVIVIIMIMIIILIIMIIMIVIIIILIIVLITIMMMHDT